MRRCAVALAFLACACALGKSEYQRASERASATYVSGAYERAEHEWREAERLAESDRDRAEARYRAAQCAERSGDLERAANALQDLAVRWPEGERAPRAVFDAARIEERCDAPARAIELYARVFRTYPESALATQAARRWLALTAPTPAQRLVAIEKLLRERTWSARLDEALRYDRAKSLEAEHRLDEAARAYGDLARRHPYPFGAYWDDALYRRAELERQRGRFEDALEALQELLDAREESKLSGTTERERFAPAQFLKAQILRDDLNDVLAARRAFRVLYESFPTSRLRDDALWQEAKLARAKSDEAACDPLRLLLRDIPESRYARCAGHICPSLAKASAAHGSCADYVLREIDALTNAKTRAE